MAQFAQAASLTEALHRAAVIAEEYPHAEILPLHLLKAILVPDDSIAVQCTELAGLNVHEIRAKIDAGLEDLPLAGQSVELPPSSGALKAALHQAAIETQVLEDPKVHEIHALLALTSAHGGLPKELRKGLGFRRGPLLDAVKKNRVVAQMTGGGDRGGLGTKSGSASLSYCEDLTARAERGELDPVLGRNREIARLAEVLARRRKNNCIVVGEPGTGKTAIVEGLAQMIHSGSVPPHLQGVRLYSLDLAGMIAGAKYKGEFEERFKKLLAEFAQRGNKAVLFVDETHTLLGAGKGGGGIDAANMLKPALARGDVRMIGATTTAEYRQHFEKDPAFARRFAQVRVDEPDDETALSILEGLKEIYENHHEVEIEPAALEAAVRLSRRYLTNRFLPDKAVDLLDEASADIRILAQIAERHTQEASEVTEREFMEALDARRIPRPEKDGIGALAVSLSRKVVDPETIARRIALATDIPVQKMTVSERERLINLEAELHRRVIGQDDAIHAVANSVRRARSGLKQRPQQPNGSFLFLGSTGTGKTELAKALAEFLFDDERAMIRIDMTDFKSDHSVKRLTGADPGLVGYEEGGVLTGAIRQRPYSVVLFDEVDKAHPQCLDILLPMLDDGRLEDNKGRAVDCSNTVVILTSNFEGPWIAEQIQSKGTVDRDELVERLTGRGGGLRPEVLNRFDSFQVFHPLTQSQIRQIVDLQVDRLIKISKAQGVTLEVEGPARDLVALAAYDPSMGARPVRRTIDELIGNPMSMALVGQESMEGSHVRVVDDGGEVKVSVLAASVMS